MVWPFDRIRGEELAATHLSWHAAPMRVIGVVWVGTRTDKFDETMAFFRDVLGVPLDEVEPDFAWSRMPNTSQLEVFGPRNTEHDHFTTGPVPEFLVEDLAAALEELRDAGVEILGEPHVEGTDGWLHFRAPDGNVYGLTAAPTYRRPG
jgi:predicted enzyme related to lactoylglutathione lyase